MFAVALSDKLLSVVECMLDGPVCVSLLVTLARWITVIFVQIYLPNIMNHLDC